MELGLSGLASGLDWRTLVDQLASVERTPQTRLRTEQSRLLQRRDAFSGLQAQLNTLQTRVAALSENTLFEGRQAKVGDSTIATASASAGAPLGSYTFQFSQLATAAKQQGTSNVGRGLSATADVSGVVLSSAPFASAVTAGTMTVNGKSIQVETSDTLQGVFDKISTATSGAVTGSYDATTDRISLTASSGNVILGSATDTSNFLQVAKLYDNGVPAVTSASSLGSVRLTEPLSSGNYATTVDDGGAGAGSFKVNGVAIAFNASVDSTADLISRINSSAAGVTASYDTVNDRFTLTNKSTGDVGVALEDVTGNFLAASGLSGGALERGKNLLYTINGGATMVSRSNTIGAESSGLEGLAVTALQEGESTTVEVGTDTAKIKSAINDFLTEYNKAQSLMETQTASSTDSNGRVSSGILADDNDASDIASQLRRLAYTPVSGLSGTIKSLEQLGMTTNGENDQIALTDSSKLDAALASELTAVRDFFSNSTLGLAVSLDEFLENTAGEEGSLVTRQTSLSGQSATIDRTVADLERQVLSNRQAMIDRFVLMETAQQKVNQQLQYLSQRFG